MAYDSTDDTLAHIADVRKLLLQACRDLLVRGHDHDASKLEEPEKSAFDKFTPKLKDLTYGSDEYRATLSQMRPALSHHYSVNRHHPEFHKDGIADMNLLDVIEMLADWKAASLRHADGDLAKSIQINAARFAYGREMTRLLTNTARDLGWI